MLLQLLLEKLKTVKPETFNMTCWCIITECGTICCAGGHACSIPELKQMGLRLYITGMVIYPIQVVYHGVEYNGYSGFDALSELLDISLKDVMYLFGSSKYMDASLPEVIKRFEQYIERQQGIK